MGKYDLIILVSIFLLAGCGKGKDGKLTLVNNKWIDEFCSFQIEVDAKDKEHKIYYKSFYEFTPDDKIYFGSKIYNDENCTNLVKEYPLYKVKTSWIYHDFGKTINNKDYTVHKVSVATTFGVGGKPITIEDIKSGEILDNQLIIDGLYAINTKRVCFSENIYGVHEHDYSNDNEGLTPSNEFNITYRKVVGLNMNPGGLKEVGYQNCIVKY
jgi:hypothetical protein